jgi:polysaccharide biosynthesis transport protein
MSENQSPAWSDWPRLTLSALSRRRRLFLGITAAVLVFNSVFLLVAERTYKAEAVIQVDDRQRIIESSSLLAPLNVETGALKSEIDRLRAPATALHVIRQLQLLDEPEYRKLAEPGLFDELREKLKVSANWSGLDWIGSATASRVNLWFATPSEAQRKREFEAKALKQFLKRLGVSNEPRTHTIRISFSSASPELSARVANAVAYHYIDSEVEAKRYAGEIAASWFSKELAELRQNVVDADRRLARYREEHKLGGRDVPPPSDQQLVQVNESLIIATTDYARAASRYAQARRAAEGGQLRATQDALALPSMQFLHQQRTEADRRVAELSERYGPRA